MPALLWSFKYTHTIIYSKLIGHNEEAISLFSSVRNVNVKYNTCLSYGKIHPVIREKMLCSGVVNKNFYYI